MQFTLVAEDGKDTEALNRRMAARDQHLEAAKKLKAEGHVLYGAALLGDEGKIVGSVYVFDFPSRADLDTYLKTEPYVVGNVWKTMTIRECKVSPLFVS